MYYSDLQKYILKSLSHVPCEHWVTMSIISIALTLVIILKYKFTVYRAISLGFAVFFGLFLIDMAVVVRLLGYWHHGTGYYGFNLDFNRLIHASTLRIVEVVSNIAVFVPLGFFLTEFLISIKSFVAWHRIGFTTLVSFVFSLSIECLQFILHVGYFEITDLFMNTIGGFVGAVFSLLGQLMLACRIRM